ncbi:MAG: ComF family protein [Lysobacter sp.]|nr:ComF family protein [Lysobacter sp.]
MSSPVNLEPMRRPWAGLRAAFDRLWPAHCLVCGERAGNGDLCAACLRELPWNRCACPRCGLPLPLPGPACGHCQRRPPPLTETRAVFRYALPLDRLLPRLKFHRDLAAGRTCALRMADALASAPRPDALVPLPLHRSRLRERGFDQALELARPLAKALDLPLLDRALVRVRDTVPQSRLDAPARRRNLRRAFAVPPGVSLPAHVALVDDVMTTGATLHAAADVLLGAGVTRVDAWVCARVA